MRKRINLFLLILCLACSLFSVNVYAADIVDSGTCGENLTWKLDNEGVLTISGEGKMEDYSDYYEVPWYDRQIKTVVIEKGVTSIGGDAFYGCGSLTSIILPEGIASIGEDAFYGCSSLTSISLPEGVMSIGGGAFNACESLTSISLPDGITRIASDTFLGCRSLISVSISESVTKIGYSAFQGCTSLKSINIPKGVTAIGRSAFRECSSLTSISLPEEVTGIGPYTFYGCSSLTDISLPEGITSISEFAFEGCSSLTSISLPEGITNISESAFEGCSSLTSISLPKGVTNIGESAFKGCSSLTSISLPEEVTSIGESAFEECSSFTSINIPQGITSIDDRVFYRCSSLTSINLPEGVMSIGSSAFYRCSSLTSISLPEGITSIGEWVFYRCSNLTSITIPKSITSIAEDAFEGCQNIEDVYYGGTIEDWNSLTDWIDATYVHYECSEPNGHWKEQVSEPTCTETGSSSETCSCGYERSQTIAALGHDWDEGVVTPPTETEKGYTTHTCTRCGEKLVDNYTDALDHEHTWNDGEVTKEATCTENGEKTYTCTTCNETRTEVINATGHDYQDGVCKNCGSKEDDKQKNPFVDVKESDYFYEAVLWAYNNNIVAGKDETHFAPSDSCTRAQSVTFLWRANGKPEPELTQNPFVDVNSSDYYYKAVLWAYENGITSGKDENHFEPKDTVTRKEFLTFLWRSEGKPEPKTTDNPFVDVPADAYYTDAVLWAYENGITSGSDETHFSPDKDCLRCQVVTFLYRFLG